MVDPLVVWVGSLTAMLRLALITAAGTSAQAGAVTGCAGGGLGGSSAVSGAAGAGGGVDPPRTAAVTATSRAIGRRSLMPSTLGVAGPDHIPWTNAHVC